MRKEMVRTIVRILIVLPSMLSGLLTGAAHGANDAAAGAVAQGQASRRGVLYRVKHGDGIAYLFGTVHVGRPDFFPLPPEVMRALTDARRLAVELDIREDAPFQQALQRHGLYAADDGIANHLSAPALQKLRQALARFGMPFEQVARMKPWMLANLLSGLSLEKSGYRRLHGAEFYLLAQAQQQHKTVRELESADYQMALFDAMSEREQETYLLESLADLDDDRAVRRDIALLDAWSRADRKAYETALRETVARDTLSADFTRRILLGRRNPEMADKVAALLQEQGSSFVAVGLLHLLGKDGLPELLRQRGCEVERLY
jgi:uncharacterized protein YbaP (TraB family)